MGMGGMLVSLLAPMPSQAEQAVNLRAALTGQEQKPN
jgi:hypothetical protein